MSKFIQTINPATEQSLNEYLILTENEIDFKLNYAYKSFKSWSKINIATRSQSMLKLASLLKKKKEELAHLMACEMGKPIKSGILEIEKCALLCEHYALHSENYLTPHLIKTEMHKTFVCYQAQGLVLAIMPWNFPFWQVFRAAVPALMAGNGVILKHAPNTTGCGQKIIDLFIEADFPQWLFQAFVLDNFLTLKTIAHKYIIGVTFTGSVETGKIIAMTAGKNLKKVILELGGNDPYIVLEDANLDLAADSIVTSRLNNCGQVCIAPKRIIVVKTILDLFVAKIISKMANYKMGDPLLNETNLGPMARDDLRNKVHKQVVATVKSGATLHNGGKIPKGKGFYYPPTLLLNVTREMPAFNEELFGPVINIIAANDEQDAITLANNSEYGLGGGVFTNNIKRGEEIAKNEIEAGSCFVNTFVSSDPRVPFGGIKNSGFGRELSKEGIVEFVNIKTVSIKAS